MGLTAHHFSCASLASQQPARAFLGPEDAATVSGWAVGQHLPGRSPPASLHESGLHYYLTVPLSWKGSASLISPPDDRFLLGLVIIK